MDNQEISTVLVANRGEIACRVMRTLHDEGLTSVAVYSDADADAPHVRLADKAVHIGPAPARDSYLVIDKIIDAAASSGAQAIHPGYGFLSENAAFARACEDNGIIFIGPPASAIETMGDKISARAAVEARDVPTVPGLSRPGLTDEDLLGAAEGIGFPILIKPSAGGGGKGMHRTENLAELKEALVTARREAAGAFGDDTLFIEHFVDTPRHIEVQIVADAHGNVIHLGERECSLQRRHQKVIEEAPSPLLDAATRARIGAAACDAARSVGYVGAGTVEFIVPAARPDHFYFMEMNTRLQVEHPVTEQVTGLNLVSLQLAVANGDVLPLTQDDVTLTGHSIEARIYAEDPANGFLPTGGRVTSVHEPAGEGVRVDSGINDGSEVTSLYDPMLMKVIAYGSDRTEALARLDNALAHTVVAGIGVNTDFCRFLINNDDVAAGNLDTGLLDRIVGDYEPGAVSERAAMAAAVMWLAERTPTTTGSAWATPDGWRAGRDPVAQKLRLIDAAGDVVIAAVAGTPSAATVTVDDGEPVSATAHRAGEHWRVTLNGTAEHWTYQDAGKELIVSGPDGAWSLTKATAASLIEDDSEGGGTLFSPMPGTVIAHIATEGDTVATGDAVLVVEAMKMEHTLRAEIDGTVSFHCSAGDQVSADKPLATIEPTDN